jgi:hypothetical protein
MSENQISSWCETLRLVPVRWRADFVRFVEEGEASEEFIALLEHNTDCRTACEQAFRADCMIVQLLNALGEEYEPDGLPGLPDTHRPARRGSRSIVFGNP